MPETLQKDRTSHAVDAMLPPEMALACEAAGAAKAGRDALTLVVLGVLASAFIALGAIFMTLVLTGPRRSPGVSPGSWARSRSPWASSW